MIQMDWRMDRSSVDRGHVCCRTSALWMQHIIIMQQANKLIMLIYLCGDFSAAVRMPHETDCDSQKTFHKQVYESRKACVSNSKNV